MGVPVKLSNRYDFTTGSNMCVYFRQFKWDANETIPIKYKRFITNKTAHNTNIKYYTRKRTEVTVTRQPGKTQCYNDRETTIIVEKMISQNHVVNKNVVR